MRIILASALLLAVACNPPRREDDTTDDTTSTPDAGQPVTDSCGGCPGTSKCVDGTCVGSDPASCLDASNCVGDSDCASGSRCNKALSPPRCEKLYCGAAGATCGADWFCTSGLECGGNLCRPPPPTGATVNGSVEDVTLAAKDAILVAVTDFEQLALVITDFPNACDTISHRGLPAGSTSLGIYFISGTPTVRSYPVSSGFGSNSVLVSLGAYSPSCARRTPMNSDFGTTATSGNVVVTDVDLDTYRVRGTFDVVFSGEHFSGTFNSQGCSERVTLNQVSRCGNTP